MLVICGASQYIITRTYLPMTSTSLLADYVPGDWAKQYVGESQLVAQNEPVVLEIAAGYPESKCALALPQRRLSFSVHHCCR